MTARSRTAEPVVFQDVLYFLMKNMEAEGPLSDLLKSAVVLAPISGSLRGRPLLTRVRLGCILFRIYLVLRKFLERFPQCRNRFFLEPEIIGISALAFDYRLTDEEKKQHLIEAARRAPEVARLVESFPQLVTVLVWKTNQDAAMTEAVRMISRAIIARIPEYVLTEFPHGDGMILANHKITVNFTPLA